MIQVVQVPAQQAAGARPRAQSIYDSERSAAAAAPSTQLNLFSNFASFANAAGTGGTLTKNKGVWTNLSGQQGFAAGHHHYVYQANLKIVAPEVDFTLDANAGVLTDIHRWRVLSYIVLRLSSSELYEVQSEEWPSGTGPQYVATTKNSAFEFSLPTGVPIKTNAFRTTIAGKPLELVALESFQVEIHTPAAGQDQSSTTAFVLTRDLYCTAHLGGIFLRPLT